MFDRKTTIAARLTDAVDLVIDFATLGEYGLEPVGRTPSACETRSRPPTWAGGRTTAGPSFATRH